MSRTNLLIGTVLALSACGTGMKSTSARPESGGQLTISESGDQMRITERAVVEANVPLALARVWSELPQVYDSLGITIAYVDARRHEIGNAKLVKQAVLGKERLSTFLRCGTGPGGDLADSHRVNMNLKTSLEAVGSDSTRVVTQFAASATPLYGASSGTVSCSSTGRLEGMISQALLRRLILPAPKS